QPARGECVFTPRTANGEARGARPASTPTNPAVTGQVLTRLALPPDRPLRRIRDQHHGTSQRCPATKRSGCWPTPPTMRTNCRPHGCADRRYLRGSGMLVGLLAVMLRRWRGAQRGERVADILEHGHGDAPWLGRAYRPGSARSARLSFVPIRQGELGVSLA